MTGKEVLQPRLCASASLGDPDTLKSVPGNRCSPPIQQPLKQPVQRACQWLQVGSCSSCPFIQMHSRGTFPGVDALLTAGADPNLGEEEGWTPLLGAVALWHSACITRLLAAGADPSWGLQSRL